MKIFKLLHPSEREELARRVLTELLQATTPREAEESDMRQRASAGEPFVPQNGVNLRSTPDDISAKPIFLLNPDTNEDTMVHQQNTLTVTQIWQKFKEANANQASALERLVTVLLENGLRDSQTVEEGREPEIVPDPIGEADLPKAPPPDLYQENDSAQQLGDGSSTAPPAIVTGAIDAQNGPAAVTPPSHSEESPDSATQQKALESVADLWERFKESIMGRVAVLEQSTLNLMEGTLDDDLRQNARREAHKLAGSVGLFGFAKGSELAQEIEQTLLQEANLDQGQVLRLSQAVVALRHELEKGGPSPITASGVNAMAGDTAHDGNSAHMLVIDHDVDLAERLVMEGMARGMGAEMATDLQGARAAISRLRPSAVLLDLSLADELGDSLSLLSGLSEGSASVPVLALTDRKAFGDRLQVARLGGRGFLPRSLPPTRVMDAVSQLLDRTLPTQNKVMVVHDDLLVLNALRTMLEGHGFSVTTLSSSEAFWYTLDESNPDLLMLDVDIPGVSGLDLCRVVRNEPRWSRLPILFLTAHADTDTIQKVFSAAGDDYVSMPIVESELVARISGRLERARLHRSTDETDALTGVANTRKATQDLNQFLYLAERHGQAVSVAALGADRFDEINEHSRTGTGDWLLRRVGEVLQKIVRSEGEEAIGRWSGDRFVMGMYGAARDDGVRRVSRVFDELDREGLISSDGQSLRVTFSAGVAEYPVDGSDLQALWRAADDILQQAQATGGGRVLPVGWDPSKPQAERVDVVLVDDDEAVAGVVLHALANRGYSTRWLQDGQEAADALGEPNPILRAKVALLDVGLPSLDGLGLLRRISTDGVLRRTRVIMLTVRSTESEVLGSLESGAFDHVAKPFSIPILMHRVRRALET